MKWSNVIYWKNKIKNIFDNKYIVFISNTFILLSLFFYLAYKLRFSYIQNDDIVDLFSHYINFYHGRFFTELFSIFIVKILPLKLNIHPQDFYIYSSQIIKSGCFVFLVYLMSISLYRFKKTDIYITLLSIISFFSAMSFLIDLNYIHCFDTYQFFMGYIFPIICFFLLWYKLSDLYIKNHKLSLKNIFYLFFLALLVTTGNEQVNIVSITLLLLLFIDSLIKKYVINKNTNFSYILFTLIISLIASIFVYMSNGFINTFNDYGLKIILNFNIKEIIDFIYVFYKKIIYDNFFLFIPLLISYTALISNKEKNEEQQKVTKYIIFSICSFLLFFCSLFLLGQTYDYRADSNYNILPRFWILYPSILFSFKIFLYIINFYTLGFLFYQKNKLVTKLVSICLILSCTLYIVNTYKNIDLSYPENRKVTYIADKIAVFYFSKGKTAILPKEKIHVIISTINNLLPYDLESNDYIGKTYYYEQYPHYLGYLNTIYNVDIAKGMIFKTEEEAISDYYKNGGSFNEKELNELKFSKISKYISN